MAIRLFDSARAFVPNAEILPAFMRPVLSAFQTGSSLHAPVLEVIAGFGFTGMSYGGTTEPAEAPSNQLHVYGWTTQPAVAREYHEKNFIAVDPRITRTWNGSMPVLWDQATERGHSAELDAFLDRALDWGVGSGIAMSFRTALGLRVMAALSQAAPLITPERRAEITAHAGDIFLFCSTFHALFSQAIVECLHAPPQEGAPISEIEGNALRLLALGKSIADIAEALVLDTYEVNLYLDHACKKLGAEVPATAVQRAQELGLLGPAAG